ncbi:thiol:disulfide interchange protein [Idiomarina sp. A28L]|uniref:protein-disulfide reductase DsbD n=1 Tax=Idiomarina sp. A28L TaxID=1036674 RepID=UPI0002138A9C|nr:protein-disulfide reductase DsbD [Idiomarina sp. A28L]EGN75322.1 thiol:disulfide interchange protein [Idiomarina sp. A28L]
MKTLFAASGLANRFARFTKRSERRVHTNVFFSLLVILLFAAPLTTTAHAQQSFFGSNTGEFLPVQEAFVLDYQQQGDTLYINFRITEGYYLYQHRFGLVPENLVGNLELPEAMPYNDEFFGDVNIYRDYVTLTVDLAAANVGDVLTVRYQGCADAGLCYAPATAEIYLQATSGDTESGGYQLADFSDANSEPSGVFQFLQPDRLALTAGVFLLLGLGLAFTPCVFPMYPIISGIIMGQKRPLTMRRGFMLSFVYVQGMAITYTILGIVVALAGMQYQAYLQHPVLLGVLAALFVIFALAMFGTIGFDLPASWRNKLSSLSQNQKGGAYPSVFLMGVISGMIASPCTTAPLSGALLFIAQSGNVLVGGVVLYALSLGMGIPLLAIGASGGKLLPKSGPWMNSVKVMFGVLMLAVALFLVERLLPLTVAAWLWIFFFVVSAIILYREFYQQFATTGRTLSAIVLIILAGVGVNWQKPYVDGSFAASKLQFEYVRDLSELEQRIAEAQSSGQWVMLDLYADWCTACLELERYTFSDPEVQSTLENFIVLQADVTSVNATNTELLSNYQVLGLPTILFFNQAGEELSELRVTGFMNAEAFQERLEQIQQR